MSSRAPLSGRGLRALARRLGRRRRSLPFWEPGSADAGGAPPDVVDVVVPVHGAGELVARCFDRVARSTAAGTYRLVVVVDGDPAFDRAWLPSAGGHPPLVLEHETGRGFVASANRGLSASDRDAVLLNSDVEVSQGWLAKLARAAYSSPDVGTVTPLSNHATICSIPTPLVANELPSGYDLDRLAALVEAVAEPTRPRLPTGVGMCLYLKRRLLDDVGLLDEVFSPGYGEEVDLCFRALRAGYRHLLDPSTFVFHHGEGSFGAGREERVAGAERRLRRRHPDYVATVAEGLTRDPVAAVRRRVVEGLHPAGRRRLPVPISRVLHLVHGWPPRSHGGTEHYAAWLAHQQATHREVAVFARRSAPDLAYGSVEREDGPIRLELVANDFDARSPLARNALVSGTMARALARTLREFRPDLVHVHHLAGHALSLMATAAAAAPVVYQVQDWWPVCARANLLDRSGALCPGPSPARCGACLPLTGVWPSGLWSRWLYRLRARLARLAVARADAYLMGSRFVEASYDEDGWLASGVPRFVLPYGVGGNPGPERRSRPTLPLRFGVVGALMPHKGALVAVEAFQARDPREATLDLWGDPRPDPDYVARLDLSAGPAVRRRGVFDEARKVDLLAGLDVLLVPSIGWESYGLVAREAFRHGVPVVASDRSALSELFPAPDRGGRLVPADDPVALRTLVDELVAAPGVVARWREGIPAVPSLEEHAALVEEVYAEAVVRRRRGA